MTTRYKRSLRRRIYEWCDQVSWTICTTGFKEGFCAGLMVSVFSVLMAYYLVVSI
jgi:hypothetical protein